MATPFSERPPTNVETRRRGVLALLNESDPERVRDDLLAALGDDDWRVRKEGSEVALRLVDVPGLIDALIAALYQGENVGLRNAALEVLGSCGRMVVEPLLAALASAPAGGRKFVVTAMGRTGRSELAPDVAQLVADSDRNVAAAAVEALGQLGNAEAQRALLDVVKSEQPVLRVGALEALRKLDVRVPWTVLAPLVRGAITRRLALQLAATCDDPGVIDALLGALRGAEGDDVLVAATSLRAFAGRVPDAEGTVSARTGEIADAARAELREAIDAGSHVERQAAAWLLLLARDRAALPGVLRLLEERSLEPDVEDGLRGWGIGLVADLLAHWDGLQAHLRATSLELCGALVAMRSESADGPDLKASTQLRERIMQTLNSNDVTQSLSALRALAGCVQAADAERLVELAQVGDPGLAEAAGEALQALCATAPEVVNRALDRADYSDVGGQALIRVAARLEGPEREQRLHAALASPDVGARRSAVEGLSCLPSLQATELLALALADEDEGVQVAAVRGLSELKDEDGRLARAEDLLVALKSESAPVRAAAALAMGATSDPRAVPSLRALVHDDSPGVVAAALQGLRGQSGASIEDVLVESLSHDDPEVVKQALHAIRHASSGSVSQLAIGLEHPSWDVRGTAARLLGELGGAEAVARLKGRLGTEDHAFVQHCINDALRTLRKVGDHE